MATNSSLLQDDVVFQSLGPLDEALHSGITYIWLTLVVACCGHNIYTSVPPAPTKAITTHPLQLHRPVMNISVSQLLVRYGNEPSTWQTLI